MAGQVPAALLCLALALVSSTLTVEGATLETYNSPTINGMPLDRCLDLADCPPYPSANSADGFCRLKGYDAAWGYDVVGIQDTTTTTFLDTLQSCGSTLCHTFNSIVCIDYPPPPAAIAGGVAGGVAVLAVLAFFTFRPRKGWLRRRQGAPAAGPEDSSELPKDGTDAASKAGDDVESGGGLAGKGSQAGSAPLMPPHTIPPYYAPGSTVTLGGTSDVQLPPSYISSMGAASQPAGTASQQGGESAAQELDTFIKQPGSASAPGSNLSAITPSMGEADMVLAAIDTYLHSKTSSATAPLGSGGSSQHSGRSASTPLPADVQQWVVRWSDVKISKQIGSGSFGWVYMGEWRRTKVAVKVLIDRDDLARGSSLQLPDAIARQLLQEAAVMAKMRHPNILNFMGICTEPPCILTEFMRQGSLYDVLRCGTLQPEAAAALTWRRRLGMAVDAATGIYYLHSHSPPIVHRDIKSPNLLVDEHWRVKVSDFNLSKILQERQEGSQSSTDGGANNPIWLAPEILLGGRASVASDCYAFALVLLELATWRLPWMGTPGYTITQKVLNGERPEVPPREALPGPDAAGFTGLDAYLQLMRECWAQEPADRPAFDDVVLRLQALLEEAGEAQ